MSICNAQVGAVYPQNVSRHAILLQRLPPTCTGEQLAMRYWRLHLARNSGKVEQLEAHRCRSRILNFCMGLKSISENWLRQARLVLLTDRLDWLSSTQVPIFPVQYSTVVSSAVDWYCNTSLVSFALLEALLLEHRFHPFDVQAVEGRPGSPCSSWRQSDSMDFLHYISPHNCLTRLWEVN